MEKLLLVIFGVVLICPGGSMAASKKHTAKTMRTDRASTPRDVCQRMTNQEAQLLLGDLGNVVAVKCAPAQGLYELSLVRENRQAVVYMDFAGKYLLPGPLFDMATRQSVTPPPIELPKILSKEQLEKVTTDHALLMGNPKSTRRVYVFTDPDCPFCGKLHGELQKLVEIEQDVAVYIKLFPLQMHPQAYDKSRSILEANSLQMLEQAFASETLPSPQREESKASVDETIKLGGALGIDGTPALILPNGRIVNGYRDIAEILRLLEEDGAGKP